MKYLKEHWKSRSTIILFVSVLVSILLMTLDQTSWAEQINLQGYTHGEDDGKAQNRLGLLRYILPFVKEMVLIGMPMLLTLLVSKLLGNFTKK